MTSLSSLILVAGLIGAPADGPTDPKMLELVRQLGHKSFKIREQAARELLQRGSESVAALNVGVKDSDPEVAERCKQLLPVASSKERNEKLIKLVKEPNSPPPEGLASLKEFLKITGDDKTNREIYAEVMGVHHQMMEALDKDPKLAGRLMTDFANEAYDRWQQGARFGRYSYDNILSNRAEVALFLFVRSDKRFKEDPTQFGRASMLVNSTKLKTLVTGPEALPGIRNLLIHWMENEQQPYMTQRAFQIAAESDMKEIVPVILRVIGDKKHAPYARAQALITLGRLGSKEHIKQVESFMTDKSNLGTINFGNGFQLTTELRDVAMGVAVQLAGQKMGDFGFDTTRFGGGIPNSYYYYGFADDGKREEAHKKWKEFSAKGTPPDKKTVEPKKAVEVPKIEEKKK